MPTLKETCAVVGNVLISGIEGEKLSVSSQKWITESSGVLLFASNFSTPLQVASLIQSIQKNASLPLWIAVDQEGGRVQRFRKGFSKIPSASEVGRRAPSEGFEISSRIAQELKLIGINLNFFPVADLSTGGHSCVIGDRSYGDDPEIVSQWMSVLIAGHLSQGVLPCVKHFPGHGNTQVDSHFGLPMVETPLSILKNREWKPFQAAFQAKCEMVMLGHLLFPSIDPKFPTSLSSIWIQNLLKKELNYPHLICTDDLEMHAVSHSFFEEDIPWLALNAGCDLLVYKSEEKARLAKESLIKCIEKRELASETVWKAVHRIEIYKKKHLLPLIPISISQIASQLKKIKNQPFP